MPAAYDDRLELDVPTIQPFMDGATQKIRDFSGKARHGTVTNFAGTDVEYEDVNGIGQCMSISTPKYVNHGQILNYTVEPFSFEFAFVPTSLANDPELFWKGEFQVNGYYARATANGRIVVVTSQLGVFQTTHAAVGTLSALKMSHIIIVVNCPTVRIYHQGIETAYSTINAHIYPSSSSDNFIVGRHDNVALNDLNGRVLRYRSWSRAIGAAEAAEKYQAWVMGR